MNINDLIHDINYYTFEKRRTLCDMYRAREQQRYDYPISIEQIETEIVRVELILDKIIVMKKCKCNIFIKILSSIRSIGKPKLYSDKLKCSRLGTIRANIKECNRCSGIYNL